MKDILKPIETTATSSPSIKHAAEEPQNWRAGGETDPKKALADNPTKKPLCPKVIK